LALGQETAGLKKSTDVSTETIWRRFDDLTNKGWINWQ